MDPIMLRRYVDVLVVLALLSCEVSVLNGLRSCSSGEFMCSDGTACITTSWVCDNEADCLDESDELQCSVSTCEVNHFQCTDSLVCIPQSLVCDNDRDCQDGSDEQGCAAEVPGQNCGANLFQCTNGDCIHGAWQCDGKDDCSDGSDENEMKCSRQGVECADTEFTCMHGACIPSSQVNDGIAQCVDGDDETNNVVCKPGYQPSTNNTCVDIDECKEWTLHKCSQECVNVIGSFLCSCSEGFEISNQTKCKALGSPPLVLYAHDHSIRKFNFTSNESIPIYTDLANPAALDISVQDGMLFWSDYTDDTIMIGSVDGSLDQAVLVDNVDLAEGIAYDWIHRNLYWADAIKKSISVISMDTKQQTTICSEDLDQLRALVVDPRNGFMYWSDWGSNPKIERAGMDGNSRKVIIDRNKTNITWPNGLAIDYYNDRLFWVDAKHQLLASCDFNGENINIVVLHSDVLRHPYDVVVFQDEVFWSDWQEPALRSVNKFTGEYQDDFERYLGLSIPVGIAVWQNSTQPLGQNYCENSECDHIGVATPGRNCSCLRPEGQSVECADTEFTCMDGACIPSSQVNDSIAQCVDGDDEMNTVVCIHGYQPSTNGTCVDIDECKEWTLHKCSQECVNVIGSFLCRCSEGFELLNHTKCKALGSPPLILSVHDHSIRKFNITSNESILVYTDLANPAALDIAVQDGMLFWSDITDDTIMIGSVDGSLDQTVLVDNVDLVEGIAYDWIHRNLYWTNANNKSISVISIDTKQQTTLCSEDLDRPRALVVDPRNGFMYWSDWGSNPKIERAGMDGSSRKVIIDRNKTDITWPNGLAIDFYNDRLFWVDAKHHVLASCDFRGENINIVVMHSDVLRHPYDVVVFQDEVFWSDWQEPALRSVNKFTGEYQDYFEKYLLSYNPYGIAVWQNSTQPLGQNYCKNSECDHVSVATPGRNCSCLRPEGQSVECADTEFTCMDGTCIPSTQVNDGIAQCVDGDDEMNTVVCKPGYEPSTNGTCIDIDECKEWTLHKCSQECVNVIGSFLCSCFEGFELSNHTKCKALGSPPLVLYVHNHSIKKFNITSNESILIYTDLANPAALDIAVQDGMLFWSDYTDDTIMIGSVDGSLHQTVLVDNVDSVEGIAYDWIHRNLYWTNAINKSISVISIDTKQQTTLCSEDLDKPRALAVDPRNGFMYWSDWGSHPKIERAVMDGSSRKVIIDRNKTNITWPNGLAIDYYNDRLFWVDAKDDVLASCDFDGENINIVVMHSDVLRHPYDVVVFQDEVFWSDWQEPALRSVNKFTGEYQYYFEIYLRSPSPFGIAVWQNSTQPLGQNYCENSKCDHIGVAATGHTCSCLCPEGDTCFNSELSAVESLIETAIANIWEYFLLD